MNVLAPKLKSAEEIDKQTQENAELMERTYERLRETETELHSANRNNLRRLISQLVLLSPHYNLIGIGVNKYLSLKKIFCMSHPLLQRQLQMPKMWALYRVCNDDLHAFQRRERNSGIQLVAVWLVQIRGLAVQHLCIL